MLKAVYIHSSAPLRVSRNGMIESVEFTALASKPKKASVPLRETRSGASKTPILWSLHCTFLCRMKYKGKFYHEKYQFADVYMTKTGRWAGTYSDDYSHPYNYNTTVKPRKIEFIDEVSYPLKVTEIDGIEYDMRYRYDEPYFKLTLDRAVAVYGNYLEELFTLKKEGVLAARVIFENPDPEEE